jgi:hypothetical protein
MAIHLVNGAIAVGVKVGALVQPINLDVAVGAAIGVTRWSFTVGVDVGVDAAVEVESFESVGISVGAAVGSTVDTSDFADYFEYNDVQLAEDERARSKRTELREYGTIVVYGRRFTCPKGGAETYENTVFWRGKPMSRQWASSDEDVSRYIDGPRVTSVQRGQEKEGGKDNIAVTYVAFRLPRDRATGYNETRRLVSGQSGYVRHIVTWGIAESETSANMPTKGSYLDGRSASSRNAKCTGVSYDITSLPGRMLVRAEWVEHEAPGAVLEASDVS